MLDHRSHAKISIRVYPGAARNEVVGFSKGVLQVRISAPPVRGKANKELVVFLSQLLNLRKSNITITKGNTSRNKIVVIHDLSLETALKLLLIEPGFEL
ncbi:MAG: DUF167 domain-containing protein [Dehalococcoidales bacterium]|jgi:hypothetical protein|nr:DUF167 domain-containing protein [Dehalococcoidales bacterium]